VFLRRFLGGGGFRRPRWVWAPSVAAVWACPRPTCVVQGGVAPRFPTKLRGSQTFPRLACVYKIFGVPILTRCLILATRNIPAAGGPAPQSDARRPRTSMLADCFKAMAAVPLAAWWSAVCTGHAGIALEALGSLQESVRMTLLCMFVPASCFAC
jgi:hypothetical protein